MKHLPTAAANTADPGSQSVRLDRRRALLSGLTVAWSTALPSRAGSAATTAGSIASLRAPQRMAQLRVEGDGSLLALSALGELWRLRGATWQRVGAGLDPATPLALGHGRVVGRGAARGGLWVMESGRVKNEARLPLATDAGLLVLPLAVIAITAAQGGHRVVRLEEGAGGWKESARSNTVVLPDAQPVQWDPQGTAGDGDGQVAVLAGPDTSRYHHGALGDNIEATSLVVLDRHDLRPLSRLDLPSPFVFEDIAPRPIAWRGGRALLTVRSGPQGAQLAVVAASGSSPQLELSALGSPLGRPQRWMAPTTDGVRLMAVHTPHIGGVLHRYIADGKTLSSEVAAVDVANHINGHRDLDISVWMAATWVTPAQDRRSLRFFDMNARQLVSRDVKLDGVVMAMRSLERNGRAGVAALLEDGSVVWVEVPG